MKVKKNQNYHSLHEFEERFYPKSSRQQHILEHENPQDFGIKLAQMSLRKIRHLISEEQNSTEET